MYNNKEIVDIYNRIENLFDNDKKRFHHIVGVADTAFALAACHGTDINKAYIAGLLHDCAKNIPDSEQLGNCNKFNIDISEFELKAPYLLHAKLGAYFAKNDYGINDNDIINAIRFHTTGRPNMTQLEKIIFIADYIEPLRCHADNLDEIRVLSFKDLDMTIKIITEDSLEHLKSKKKVIDPRTEATYKYYS